MPKPTEIKNFNPSFYLSLSKIGPKQSVRLIKAQTDSWSGYLFDKCAQAIWHYFVKLTPEYAHNKNIFFSVILPQYNSTSSSARSFKCSGRCLFRIFL